MKCRFISLGLRLTIHDVISMNRFNYSNCLNIVGDFPFTSDWVMMLFLLKLKETCFSISGGNNRNRILIDSLLRRNLYRFFSDTSGIRKNLSGIDCLDSFDRLVQTGFLTTETDLKSLRSTTSEIDINGIDLRTNLNLNDQYLASEENFDSLFFTLVKKFSSYGVDTVSMKEARDAFVSFKQCYSDNPMGLNFLELALIIMSAEVVCFAESEESEKANSIADAANFFGRRLIYFKKA